MIHAMLTKKRNFASFVLFLFEGDVLCLGDSLFIFQRLSRYKILYDRGCKNESEWILILEYYIHISSVMCTLNILFGIVFITFPYLDFPKLHKKQKLTPKSKYFKRISMFLGSVMKSLYVLLFPFHILDRSLGIINPSSFLRLFPHRYIN